MTSFDPNLKHVTDELLIVAKQQQFWQQLEVEVMALGGDTVRARAVVEYLLS